MPIIIEWTYSDGTKEVQQLPAEVWRLNEAQVTKTFLKDKEVLSIAIDPNQELPDVNLSNNNFPRPEQKDKFEEMKKGN